MADYSWQALSPVHIVASHHRWIPRLIILVNYTHIDIYLQYAGPNIIISLLRTPGEEKHIRASQRPLTPIRISERMVNEEMRWQGLNLRTTYPWGSLPDRKSILKST